MGIGVRACNAGPPSGVRGGKVTKQAVLAGLIAGAVAVGAGGVAVASGPSGAMALRGCYAARNGALRLLTRPGQTCAAGERPVYWSQGSISWQGRWRSGRSYAAGDAVSYQGSSYVAGQASSGRYPPLSPNFWSVLAAAGRPGQAGPSGPSGTTGSAGPTGPPGTGDYAEFYNTAGTGVSSGGALPFPTAGPQHGSVVTAGVSGAQWTFASGGTYVLSVSVPFSDTGAYQVQLNGVAVPGSIAGWGATTSGSGTGQASETVVLTTSAADQLQIINPTGNFEFIAELSLHGARPSSTLLIQKIA